jgi:hypothetical protein
MPRTKLTPYECPCCGYSTSLKGNMRAHLYNAKTPCPKLNNVIDLTDDIKEHILQNRVYKVQQQQSVNQTINNFNFIQHHISNMEHVDKINKYANFKNIDIVDFEDRVQEAYLIKSKKLDRDLYKGSYELRTENILEIIDELSQMPENKIEYMNIFYDSCNNKLNLIENGAWKSFLIDQGVMKILLILKDNYFDSYEKNLIRKIKKPETSLYVRQETKEFLSNYYKFLSVYEILPCVKDLDGYEITNNVHDRGNYDIGEEFYALYIRICDQLTKSEINKIRAKVVDIVKNNTKANIKSLNKMVMDLIREAEEFRNIIIPIT